MVRGGGGSDLFLDDPSQVDENFAFWAEWVDAVWGPPSRGVQSAVSIRSTSSVPWMSFRPNASPKKSCPVSSCLMCRSAQSVWCRRLRVLVLGMAPSS